jgi:hypothetical protein
MYKHIKENLGIFIYLTNGGVGGQSVEYLYLQLLLEYLFKRNALDCPRR